MTTRRACLAALLLLCLAAQGNADSVVLKNGDRLTGEWVRVEGGNLFFKSDSLGEVTIPLAKVSTFSATKPAVVVLKNNQTVRGQIALSPSGNWQVTEAGHAQSFKGDDVRFILTEETYGERIASEHAKLWRGWKGNLNAGYNLNQGAQNARSLSINTSALRNQPNFEGLPVRWRTNYALTMLFATTTTDGVKITSNTLSTNLRQDYLFNPDNFVFVVGQLDHIQPQNLYLRQTYGGGAGRDVFKRPRGVLSLLGGVTFVNEKFSGAPSNQYAEGLVGEKAAFNISKNAHLDHYLNFYPNLSNGGQYRFDTSTMLSLHLVSRLTANIGVTDFYTSLVVAGAPLSLVGPGGTIITLSPSASKNNFAFTAGLGFNF